MHNYEWLPVQNAVWVEGGRSHSGNGRTKIRRKDSSRVQGFPSDLIMR